MAAKNPDSIVCACCNVTLETRADYVKHTKTEWHKENNKRKMFGRSILTEAQWEAEFGDKHKQKAEDAVKKENEKKEAERKQAERRQAEKEQEEVEKKAEEEKARQEKAEEDALAQDEAFVCVVFDYKAERWSHKFKIKKGCTILDLKRLMVKPDAPEEEALSFDLQKRRVRINNYDTVDGVDTFEFSYIGPEEGMKKKVKDKETKEIKEEQARQFRLREEQRKAESEKKAGDTAASEAQRKKEELERLAKEKAEAEKKRKAEREAELAKPFVEDTSGPPVDVVVKHLEKGRHLTVTVPSTCSIGYVKQEIWDTIGRQTEFDLGLKAPAADVSKLIPGLDPFDPKERLGKHRELFTKGQIELIANAKVAAAKAAAAKAAGPGAVTKAKPGETLYKIEHDTDGDKIAISMPKKKTIADLKRAICAQVCRGTYTAVVLASSSGSVFTDKQELDKMSAEEREGIRLAGIQICPAYPVQLRVVHADDASKPLARIVTVTVDDTAKYEDVRKAVSVQLKGKMMDVKIVGKMSGQSALTSMGDSLRLNGKREVLGLGKLMEKCSLGPRHEDGNAAAAAPKAPPENAASIAAPAPAAKEASPAAATEGPLSLDRAMELQKDLVKGFSDESYQKKQQALFAKYPNKDDVNFLRERTDLQLTVQSQVLPKYGFTGDGTKMIRSMMKAMPGGANGLKVGGLDPTAPMSPEWEKFWDQTQLINHLLGLGTMPGWEPPKEAKKPAVEEKPAAEEKPALQEKPAAQEIPSGPPVDLRIQLDPDDEFMEQDVRAPAGVDIRWVKEKLCSLDTTGQTKIDSFDLAYYGGSVMDPLPESTPIAASSRRLVILQKD